tara:strand:+ start:17212 stop:17361 length:150 start_codon:yes stop_codon:yes gene_type:complete
MVRNNTSANAETKCEGPAIAGLFFMNTDMHISGRFNEALGEGTEQKFPE